MDEKEESGERPAAFGICGTVDTVGAAGGENLDEGEALVSFGGSGGAVKLYVDGDDDGGAAGAGGGASGAAETAAEGRDATGLPAAFGTDETAGLCAAEDWPCANMDLSVPKRFIVDVFDEWIAGADGVPKSPPCGGDGGNDGADGDDEDDEPAGLEGAGELDEGYHGDDGADGGGDGGQDDEPLGEGGGALAARLSEESNERKR